MDTRYKKILTDWPSRKEMEGERRRKMLREKSLLSDSLSFLFLSILMEALRHTVSHADSG